MDFEYDGEMSPDVALEPSIRALYPFCRLTGDANVLVMPGLHSALITSRLVHRLGGGTTIGPLLIGMERPVQVAADGRLGQPDGRCRLPGGLPGDRPVDLLAE